MTTVITQPNGLNGANGTAFEDKTISVKPRALTKRNALRPHQTAQPSPTLHLVPLSHSPTPFLEKILPLTPQTRIKIGRQTSAKTAPSPSNAYFDSKVLSRTHAEVWSEKGKVYIKDCKSSNGTFLNGIRLSPEGEESGNFELNDGDSLEFGIDILNDDGSVLYHKVACKIYIPNSLGLDTQTLIRDLASMGGNPISIDYPQSPSSPPPGTDSKPRGLASKQTFDSISKVANFGKSAGFESLLNRLQTELVKSQEFGAELQAVKGMVTELQDGVLSEEGLARATTHTTHLTRHLSDTRTQLSIYVEKHRQQEILIQSLQSQLHSAMHRINEIEKENVQLKEGVEKQVRERIGTRLREAFGSKLADGGGSITPQSWLELQKTWLQEYDIQLSSSPSTQIEVDRKILLMPGGLLDSDDEHHPKRKRMLSEMGIEGIDESGLRSHATLSVVSLGVLVAAVGVWGVLQRWNGTGGNVGV